MKTFAEISRLYQRARDVSPRQGSLLAKICAVAIDGLGEFGTAPANKIRNRHVAEVARRLYPGDSSNSSRNRAVVVPISAALRWAALEELISSAPIIERFKEDKILPRRPDATAIDRLIANSKGIDHTFLVLLKLQGWRLSEALGLRWEDVDIEAGTLTVWVGKVRTEKRLAMHPDVAVALWPGKKRGLVFPWETPARIYAWLNPLCDRLGVKCTPHQFRHEFASRLNEVAGSTPNDIKSLGTWTSTSSIERYVAPSDSHVREMLAKL